MQNTLLIIIAFFLSFAPCQAQSHCPTGKEGNIWYFGGDNAFDVPPIGMDFNDTGTGQPAFLGDGEMRTYEAAAIMSDGNGQLLFYSNGRHVWNRQHTVMPTGMWLDGNQSATQIIALPWPGHDGQYFLIYPEAIEATNLFQNPDDTVRHVYYSIIDMSLDGGLGDVTVRDALLHEHTTEKIAAVRHCNGQDWWVITHGSPGNTFHAWLLGENGLAAQPVDSHVGRGNNGINHIFNMGGVNGILSPAGNTSGVLQASPDGLILGMATLASATFWGVATFDGFFELFRFDNATGEVSEPMLIADSLRSIYGVAFSPDNSKVYCKVWDPWERVLQYDLGTWDADSIIASMSVVANVDVTSNDGAMQLGPDGRIYIANAHYQNIPHRGLDVIEYPNEKGAACGYRPANTQEGYLVPDTSEATCGLGMPTFPASYFAPLKPYLEGPRQVCAGEAVAYRVTGNCAPVDFGWEAPGGEVLLEEGDTAWVRFMAAGAYEVVAHRVTACATFSDTLRVIVSGGMATTDTLYICKGDSVEVFGQWVAQEGLFSENLTSSFGCDSMASLQVLSFPVVDTTLLSSITCDEMAVGVFAQTLINMNGCDSLVIETISLVGDDTTFISSTTCDPGGAGVFTETFSNVNGCDSLVIETVALQPADTTSLASTTCDPTAAGVFTEILSNADGCDSVVIETVSLVGGDTTFISSTTCDPSGAGVFTETFSNVNGCDSIVVEIVEALPVLTVSLGDDLSVLTGDSTVLVPIVNLPHDSILVWDWWPLTCSGCTELIVSPLEDTFYALTITSAEGCTASDEVLVSVENDSEDVYLPTAFSPNGDGVNDQFTVFGKAGVMVVSLMVFDRWGGLVFEKYNFPANDEAAGWDGTSDGQPLNPGVFIYWGEVSFPGGKTKMVDGAVMLLR